MVTVFANNQLMIAEGAVSVSITTDPVPMGGADRIAGVFHVHYSFGTGLTMTVAVEGSNDGQTWITVDSGTPTTAAGDIVPIPTLPTEAVHAFLRVTFTLLATGANTNGICFDYHAIIDKS